MPEPIAIKSPTQYFKKNLFIRNNGCKVRSISFDQLAEFPLNECSHSVIIRGGGRGARLVRPFEKNPYQWFDKSLKKL